VTAGAREEGSSPSGATPERTSMRRTTSSPTALGKFPELGGAPARAVLRA